MENKPKGLAIAGLVTGIIGCVFSLATCTAYFGAPVAIIGCVLSGIALKKCGEGTGGGKGMAIAGLVTGVIGAIYGIYIIWAIMYWTSAAGDVLDAYDDAFDAFDNF